VLFRNTIPKKLFTCPLSCLCHIKSKQESSNHKQKSDSLLMINIILSVKRAGRNEVEEAKEEDIKRPSFLHQIKNAKLYSDLLHVWQCLTSWWYTKDKVLYSDLLMFDKAIFWPTLWQLASFLQQTKSTALYSDTLQVWQRVQHNILTYSMFHSALF